MPAPLELLEYKPELTQSHALQMVPLSKFQIDTTTRISFVPRTLAHLIDISILQGFSLYASKVCGLLLLSIHFPGGLQAGNEALFQDSWGASAGLLNLSCFMCFSLLYFVALPLKARRTIGMGVFGLKFSTHAGQAPDFADFLSRYLWCILNYVSLGFLSIKSLRETNGLLFHDKISETKMVQS